MNKEEDINVGEFFNQHWEQETKHICGIRTYRGVELSHEEVNENLILIREYFKRLATTFNAGLNYLKLTPFQWCQLSDTVTTTDPTDAECLGSQFWLFGFRFGAENPKHKFSLICHLDTVPAADSDEWEPFDPKPEPREYQGATQDFLIGRGCIDDKGPAVSAFIVARALAKAFDGSPFMDSTQVELIFDTSEETDMSTPYYLEDNGTKIPDFGLVYDAQWCVRAEKGCERPVFTVEGTEVPSGPLYIRSLYTSPDNSTNTIPDYAEAEIVGDASLLQDFANSVSESYERAEFDDKSYHKAKLTVTDDESVVILRTEVEGAQHGSAPEENRKGGANPLVSLANFLAGLASDGSLSVNAAATACEFVRWTWGTHVFGEAHESLYKCDTVFLEGNGTTYAVTKVATDADTNSVRLEADIRYAIDHHDTGGLGWDGKTEGLLPGHDSVFKQVFSDLVRKFNEQSSYPTVTCATATMFGPDIRVPETNADYQKIEEAFEEEMGKKPDRNAIGGGTDAKGYTFLLAAGPLMAKELGPPINYHGIDEGAPIADIGKSTEIVFNLFKKEIEVPVAREMGRAKKALKRVRELRQKGHKHCCSC